ncbi:hypothetical protein T265_12254 [Opisthorchis viverrini]|uniref:RAD51 interacting motif domain-containing protein n=1 Tax=Opisthorchis viverrini TaxID=6198 RepID=A0A074YUW8_OPIVI|nr:hypothetical protein T265_12254 [Opisthorchis viverrini]KER18498.1 hypothetical protein T265_12254 [Opisthorchis viverrini]
MTERRSGRVKKQLDYAHLAGDSDEEFFDDEPKNVKKSKPTKDDDDWEIPKDDIAPINKTKKGEKPKERERKVSKTTKSVVVSVTKKTEALVQPMTHSPAPSEPPPKLMENVLNSPISNLPCRTRVLSVASEPSTPCFSTSSVSERPRIAVTPTSGLRLGLSRNQRLRSLHPNVRIS